MNRVVDAMTGTHASDVSTFVMNVKKEHWLIWFVAKAWRSIKRRSSTAEQLLDVLFAVDREFVKRYGRKLLDFVYVVQFDGLYSYEFYKALEEAADMELVEYVVTVKLPSAPSCGDDEDCRLAVIQHEMSRVERRYVKRIVRPLAEAVEPPDDLLHLLKEVGLNDLMMIVKDVIESNLRRRVKSVLKTVEIGQRIE